jgi:hypothetical protein
MGNDLYSSGKKSETPKEKEMRASFERVWKIWPKNEARENLDVAESAYRSASKKFSLEDIEKTCVYYKEEFEDPSSKMIHPYHLSKFLEDEEKFASWKTRALFAPPQEVLDIFDATWAWYPDFKGKGIERTRRDSLRFWNYHIYSKDLQWRFICAVKQYARIRNRAKEKSVENVKFTTSFVGFVASWTETSFYDLMATDICDGVRDAFESTGLGFFTTDLRAFFRACLNKMDGDPQAAISAGIDILLKSAELAKKPVVAVAKRREAFVAEMVKSAYESSCAPPKAVVS